MIDLSVLDPEEKFQCPYCDYKGMNGLFHIRKNHPEKEMENRHMEGVTEKTNTIRRGHGMDVFNITRNLEFDAGHRVYKHESKCNHIHGHRYRVAIRCEAPKLDSVGRVIDFSVVKDLCGAWIDENLDHGMILFKDDPLVAVWKDFNELYFDDVGCQKYYVMDSNPTAENLANLLWHKFHDLLAQHHVNVTRVTVWETPNCSSEFGI